MEFLNLRIMFEGQPLPLAPLDVFSLCLWIALFGVLATVLLRVRFDREWTLTIWSGFQVKRVWQRMSDESARTGGTLTSHGMGLIAWSLLGSLWGVQLSETVGLERIGHGAFWGLVLGFTVLVLKNITHWIGAWLTLENETIARGLELDRHLRNWFLWALIALVVWEMDQGHGFTNRFEIWNRTLAIWWIWLGIKWLRQFQCILDKQVHFGWGIAYICTLEIGPAFWLYQKWG
ncbi:MAG: hypothetical protein ACO2XQ_02465 [Flavobacteriales bacterium]